MKMNSRRFNAGVSCNLYNALKKFQITKSKDAELDVMFILSKLMGKFLYSEDDILSLLSENSDDTVKLYIEYLEFLVSNKNLSSMYCQDNLYVSLQIEEIGEFINICNLFDTKLDRAYNNLLKSGKKFSEIKTLFFEVCRLRYKYERAYSSFENPYIGKDGKDYSNYYRLLLANKRYEESKGFEKVISVN